MRDTQHSLSEAANSETYTEQGFSKQPLDL